MKTDDDAMLAYRKKHFALEVVPAEHPQEPGEIRLSFTTNGRQWSSFSLLKSEARAVIKGLEAFLK